MPAFVVTTLCKYIDAHFTEPKESGKNKTVTSLPEISENLIVKSLYCMLDW